MTKQKKTEDRTMSGAERLGLRIAEMINSPRAQERCAALIHRLDTDTDQAWDAVMEMLAETDGIDMTFQDDGGVLLEWVKPTEEDRIVEQAEVETVEAAPF